MKLVPLALPALCCALLLAAPARAADDPFAAWRIPAHAWSAGNATLDLSFNRGRSTQGGFESIARSFRSSSALVLEQGYDSDPLLAWFRVSGSGTLNADSREEKRPWPDSHLVTSNARSTGAAESASLRGGVRIFPWAIPLGMGLDGSFTGVFQQDRFRDDVADQVGTFREERRDLRVRRESVREVAATATLVVGRVRDASVVYDVHVLEQRLLDAGALARPLSGPGRGRLAALLAVGPLFATAHERPTRFFWREVERVLREDGGLAGDGLDAFAVSWAQEPVIRRDVFRRLRGWAVGPAFGGNSRFDRLRDEETIDTRRWQDGYLNDATRTTGRWESTGSYDSYSGGYVAEYHRPLGWTWQLDATSRGSRPLRSEERGFTVTSAVALGWEIADRWSAGAQVDHLRRLYRRQDQDRWLTVMDDWDVRYGASLLYWIEDHLALRLGANEVQQQMTAYRAGYRRATYVSLGLSYRFLGALDAPGLLEPVRPLP